MTTRTVLAVFAVLLVTGSIGEARGDGVENNIEVLNIVDNSVDCVTFDKQPTGSSVLFVVDNQCPEALDIHPENCEPVECYAEPFGLSSEENYKFRPWDLGIDGLDSHEEFYVELQIHTSPGRTDMGRLQIEGRYHVEPSVEGGGCGGCGG